MTDEWTPEEFLETELGQAACLLEERMSLALGDDFIVGSLTPEQLEMMFLGMADVAEISYYCHRVALVYAHDVLSAQSNIHSVLQGCTSQAICLGIMLERARNGAS